MNSLKKKILIGIAFCLLLGILSNGILMHHFGRQPIIEESFKSIQNVGDNLVYRILSRMREYETFLKSIVGVSNELWSKPDDFEGAILNMLGLNKDTRIRSITVYGLADKQGKSWSRSQGLSWDQVSVKQEDLGKFEWYRIGKIFEPNRLYWNRAHLDNFSNELVVTGIYKTVLKNNQELLVSIDLQLTGLNAITEKLEKDIDGSYIFITDQSNQMLVSSAKMKKRTQGTRFRNTNDFKEMYENFEPINDVFDNMKESVLEAAVQMPSYNSDRWSDLKVDDLDEDYLKLSLAIGMDPLIRATFFSRKEFSDDFVIQDSCALYTFYVPDTYWKLGIVVPSSYETSVASAVTRLFYLNWIGSGIVVLFLISCLLNRFIKQPLSQLKSQLDSLIAAIEKSNWLHLKEMSAVRFEANEFGSIQNQMVSLLQQILGIHERGKKEKEVIKQNLKNIQQNRDKVLDRCEKLDQEAKFLKLEIQKYVDEENEELSAEPEKSVKTEKIFKDLIRNSKGLPLTVVPIWNQIIYLPYINCFINDNWESQHTKFLEMMIRSENKFVLLSLTGLSVDKSSKSVERILQLRRSLVSAGIQVYFINAGSFVATEFAKSSDHSQIFTFRSIQDTLQQIWSQLDLNNQLPPRASS